MAAATFSQSLASSAAQSAVPDYILYDAFFYRVTWFDQVARDQIARGRNGASLRSAIRREVNLTAADEERVKGIAEDYREKALGLAAAARNTPNADGPSAAVLEGRKQLVMSHIAQLRSALGSASFQRLDAYVRKTVRVQTAGSR